MTKAEPFGIIPHSNNRRTDYLFRFSIKAIIRNDLGEVLVVKEDDHTWWDLPGGGVDHGETLKQALARELHEEVALSGDFDHRIIMVHDPSYLTKHNFWQVLVICEVTPTIMSFHVGKDANSVAFVNPARFKDSPHAAEQRVYRFASTA